MRLVFYVYVSCFLTTICYSGDNFSPTTKNVYVEYLKELERVKQNYIKKLTDSWKVAVQNRKVKESELIKSNIEKIENELKHILLDGAMLEDKLRGKRFIMKRKNGVLIGNITLFKSGKLNGKHDNESFWRIDPNGNLIFLNEETLLSTLFHIKNIVNDKYYFEGNFKFDNIVHVLIEK